MSADQYTTLHKMLDDRMNRLQTDIEEIKKWVMNHPPCPAPGTCLQLKESVAEIRDAVKTVTERVDKLEKREAWLVGVGCVIMLAISLFAPAIRHALGMEKVNAEIIHIEDRAETK